VALTFPLPAPGEASVLDAETVDEVFRDLQDEIVLHLGETWPTAPGGRMLRATARESDGAVDLGFEPTSGDSAEALELESFVPPGIGGARVAG
jgi:hypothetical protein